MPARILVIHWNEAEALERAERVRALGFEPEVFWRATDGGGVRRLRQNPPEAIVIDLTRIPSSGQAVGIMMREQKATRAVPLLFIEGDPAKTERVRSLLPDAVYTTWERLGPALSKALRAAPANPVVPGTFAGYSGTPLSKKLRICAGSRVLLVAAPENFEEKLEPLPEGASIHRRGARDADVILAFVTTRAAMLKVLAALAGEMRAGRTLWFIWPKKTSALAGELSEPLVREMGLDAGLVDYKVCAVDETWSGLAFAERKEKRAAAK